MPPNVLNIIFNQQKINSRKLYVTWGCVVVVEDGSVLLECAVIDPGLLFNTKKVKSLLANTTKYSFQTHALSLRRAVPGRRKPFDELLAEHKARVNCEKEQQQNQALKLQEQVANQKPLDATPKRTSSSSDSPVSSSTSSRFGAFLLTINFLNLNLILPLYKNNKQ